ncbi:MAG TPA: replication-associated recombination protein A [Candidatus Gastranaerophilales bacterium]|nr:replication-associated recombination protein A [Candidatus Gastranaerophilales bacterium]
MTKQTPLAEILRPSNIDEFLGQRLITDPDSSVYNLIKSGKLFSMILWGPPGCGKTTFARIIAQDLNCVFTELSAVNSGIKDLREITAKANEVLETTGINTLVFIDEIHRYSKTQQDALLPFVEKGIIYLIGATTENPSFQVIPALLSRVQTVILKPLDDENILKIVRKGYSYLMNKYGKAHLDPKVGEFIIRFSGGDARAALNLVENSYFASGKDKNITVALLENLVSKKTIKYGIDEHYDIASAFQKSLRGSDHNAAIYWLAKMISGGEDPRFIARRLIVTASEDVGNADPNALNIALNAYKSVELLGFPEGRIPLAQAVIYIAKAPKSNTAIKAIDKALQDIEINGKSYPTPMHLRDSHYKDAVKYGFGRDYIYSPDNPEIKQDFLPEELKGRKYVD